MINRDRRLSVTGGPRKEVTGVGLALVLGATELRRKDSVAEARPRPSVVVVILPRTSQRCVSAAADSISSRDEQHRCTPPATTSAAAVPLWFITKSAHHRRSILGQYIHPGYTHKYMRMNPQLVRPSRLGLFYAPFAVNAPLFSSAGVPILAYLLQPRYFARTIGELEELGKS